MAEARRGARYAGVVRIVLMGLRGSGKSTLGARLAARRGEAFIDLDDTVLRRLGMGSVREAWARCGEPAFRAAEVEALREALGRPGTVLALGGGTPTAPGAADLLRRPDIVTIYLRASAAVLRARLTASGVGDRPALRSAPEALAGLPGSGGSAGVGVLGEIEAVLAERDPLYLRLAGAVIEVDGLSEEATEAEIERIAGRARGG